VDEIALTPGDVLVMFTELKYKLDLFARDEE
jgi:hypothetical protein